MYQHVFVLKSKYSPFDMFNLPQICGKTILGQALHKSLLQFCGKHKKKKTIDEKKMKLL